MQPPDVQRRGHNQANYHHHQTSHSGLYPNISQPNYSEAGSFSSPSNYANSPYYSPYGGPGQQGGYNPYTKTPANTFGDGYFNVDSSQQNQYFNPMQNFPAQQLMSDPMVNAAKAYGEQFAEQQKEKISKFVSIARLKYYFAVDNAYVGKKLGLLLFPFAHTDWSVKYNTGEDPIPPRLDVNAPDLYIPTMAIVTYVLVVGFVLGTQNRFSPEHLGATTSRAMAVVLAENVLILLTKYAMNISQALSLWHTLAFSSYKFVGMIVSLLVYLVAGKMGYYIALLYTAGAVAFFLMRTVKVFVLDSCGSSFENGTKRKLYLLLFISLTQPLIMWWLTSSVASYHMPPEMPGFMPPISAKDGGKMMPGKQLPTETMQPKMAD